MAKNNMGMPKTRTRSLATSPASEKSTVAMRRETAVAKKQTPRLVAPTDAKDNAAAATATNTNISKSVLTIEILFPLLTALAGFLGGLHFPLANHAFLAEDTEVGRTAGLINGIDLLGTSVGVLLAGIVILPILGIPKTLYFVAALNVVVIFPVALRSRLEERK